MIAAFAAAPANAEPARSILGIDYNLDHDRPGDPNLNRLDLHLPATSAGEKRTLRPLVIWIHGGGFIKGDKSNRMANKVRLFNALGYILASVNYRLSPDISTDCCEFDPGRVRAPAHISDLAEAVGWLSRNIRAYGGDPDSIVLVGHSAGAQLVSLAGTSPVWLKDRRVSPQQVLGAVSLDTDTFDVRAEAADSSPLQARMLAWNAFGTPTEEAADARWDGMSPIRHADPSDPEFLFVTQSARPGRIAADQAMATALGQEPASVVGVPYSHEAINTMLGSTGDISVETDRVRQFVRQVVAEARPAGVKITRRPPKRIVVRVRVKKAGAAARKRALPKVRRKVTFSFKGTGRTTGFQCRIDRQKYTKCKSPRTFRLRPGKHTFKVRPQYPSGKQGKERKITFRILARYSR